MTWGLAALFWSAACSGGERSASRRWHEPVPRLRVAVTPDAWALVVHDTVRVVAAPLVRFLALVQPDPSHISPVSTSASGVLGLVDAARRVRSGDTLAVVGKGPGIALVAVLAPHDGAWKPRRQSGQVVAEDDTLGVVEQRGYWWAVGTVSDVEGATLHIADPGSVLFEAERPRARPGRVEWVRRPDSRSPYSTGVGVEFRHEADSLDRSAPVTVALAPADPQDSLPAVPAAAVVQLPLGPAVFVPVDSARYEVRWLSVGPSVGPLLAVREGVEPGTVIAAYGLFPLFEAARESLARRADTLKRGR